MKFKYIALGSSNQKLEGVLEAESLDDARKRLHKMSLSIVSIKEIGDEKSNLKAKEQDDIKKTEGINTYFFLAKGPHKKEINGTIDAKDPFSAFRRLITEYHFNVLDLTKEDMGSFQEKFKEWKSILEEEGINLSQKAVMGVKGENEKEEIMSNEIITEIDQFIINTKKIIQEHQTQYSDAFLTEIQKTLDNLQRIRGSNNLKHITKVCNKLYELVANPDAINVADERMTEASYAKTILDLKESGFIANRFQLLQAHKLHKKAARFGKIQKVFARILKSLNKKKTDEIEERLNKKLEKKSESWISKLATGLQVKETRDDYIGLKRVIVSFFEFLFTGSAIMRRVKKQEMIKIYKEWRKSKKQKDQKTQVTEKGEIKEGLKTPKKDFSNFFLELDSFVGWLLFFYIAYFFLVNFSIEKGVGLPKSIVFKSLSSPLIINISLFLLFAHLAFKLKLHLFRSNFLGSAFLFFLSFGAYALLVLNF